MDSSTLYILQILGPVVFVEGLSLFFGGRSFFKNLMNSLKTDYLAMYISGLMALVLGIVIVLSQQVLSTTASVILTVVGWIAIIKGVLILLLPKWSTDLFMKFDITSFIKIYGVVLALVGLYVVWVAYY